MILLSLVWWALLAGAAYQAHRAWGPKAGLSALIGIGLVGFVPLFGGVVSAVAAVYVGYRAENTIDARHPLPPQLPG